MARPTTFRGIPVKNSCRFVLHSISLFVQLIRIILHYIPYEALNVQNGGHYIISYSISIYLIYPKPCQTLLCIPIKVSTHGYRITKFLCTTLVTTLVHEYPELYPVYFGFKISILLFRPTS